jgi:hypothetical protein
LNCVIFFKLAVYKEAKPISTCDVQDSLIRRGDAFQRALLVHSHPSPSGQRVTRPQ